MNTEIVLNLDSSYHVPHVRQNGISDFIEDKIREVLGKEKLSEKNIGDIWLDEKTPINIKSIDVEKVFHMPNLLSVKKCYDLLKDRTNNLLFIFVEYKRAGEYIHIEKIEIKKIEELTGLVVQAQGEGVIQLKKGKNRIYRDAVDREVFLNELRQMINDFICKQMNKWYNRLEYYEIL